MHGFRLTISAILLLAGGPGFAGELADELLQRVSARVQVEAGPRNFTPLPFAVLSEDCSQKVELRLAAGGEACGCKAYQSCCDKSDRCCPSTHPHRCASGYCYRTAADARSDCGNGFEVCGVPR